jgi:membrane glycosyltransferase
MTEYEKMFSAIPPENPLDMPITSLKSWDSRDHQLRVTIHDHFSTWLARVFVFGLTFLLTVYGAHEMYRVVSVWQTTVLQWILLALFVINFSWIALAFSSSCMGFALLLKRCLASRMGLWRQDSPDSDADSAPLKYRTALVMPVYNESPDRVFGAITAIRESVESTGHGDSFDYFILSDSTNPEVWIQEEALFLEIRKLKSPGAERVFYRHRSQNTERKTGNIRDFIMRWGGAYEHMIILDADSLMTGACIVHLAQAMERDETAGIIQSLPIIINRNTLFARLQQFAACVYGPIIVHGLASWMGIDGNYWGHNAIIRLKAFAAHCGLPVLSGPPPFGGPILSHDFIEAALVRRAGWSVTLLPDLSGSYEESPPTLIDLMQRDRRWCQGNLQHIRLLWTPGFKLASRQHLMTGIMGYLAAPFWFLQLLIGIVLVLQTQYVRPEYFSHEFSLLPIWPRFDAQRALWLFALTMSILLMPKILGMVLTLIRGWSGNAWKLCLSTVFEILFSALLAPILMVVQSFTVLHILLGSDSGWTTQRRDDGTLTWWAIIRYHLGHTFLGIFASITSFKIAFSLFAWMSPTALGLLLSIPLSWFTGLPKIGLLLKQWGLLSIPEEANPPAVLLRSANVTGGLRQGISEDANSLTIVSKDTSLRTHHLHMLPHEEVKTRGVVNALNLVVTEKLKEAQNFEEALLWLNSPDERRAVLSDRSLIERLIALPSSTREGSLGRGRLCAE